jgi:GAF domain-containing protein
MTELASLLARPGQPDTMFKAVDDAVRDRVGHQLFTLLYVDGGEVARCYSSRPAEYPVAGRKPMGATPWGDLVLRGQQPYVGRDKAGIRWAFFDHALIESMGLGAVINIPVIYDGAVIGTMNVLDAEHSYGEHQIPLLLDLAPLLIPAFLQARR